MTITNSTTDVLETIAQAFNLSDEELAELLAVDEHTLGSWRSDHIARHHLENLASIWYVATVLTQHCDAASLATLVRQPSPMFAGQTLLGALCTQPELVRQKVDDIYYHELDIAV